MNFKDMQRHFRKNKAAMLGLTIVVVISIMAIFSSLLSPYEPSEINLYNVAASPSTEHLFGTDQLGRDILSRLIHGARISLIIGGGVVGFALLVGTGLGLVSGYFRSVLDALIMRLVDILMAFPTFLLALAIVSALGPNLYNVIIAVGISSIPRFARLTRGAVLSIREQEYVEAAKAIGGGHIHIMLRHILPNSFAPVLVQGTLLIANALLISAGLGFLGLGAQPPTPEWGVMLSDGRGFLRTAPHIATFPGLAIMFTVMGFNLLGDGLRDVLDVRLAEE